MRLDVYKHSAAIINISNNPIASPARSTLQGIANRDVPIIVFHIAKLKSKYYIFTISSLIDLYESNKYVYRMIRHSSFNIMLVICHIHSLV